MWWGEEREAQTTGAQVQKDTVESDPSSTLLPSIRATSCGPSQQPNFCTDFTLHTSFAKFEFSWTHFQLSWFLLGKSLL